MNQKTFKLLNGIAILIGCIFFVLFMLKDYGNLSISLGLSKLIILGIVAILIIELLHIILKNQNPKKNLVLLVCYIGFVEIGLELLSNVFKWSSNLLIWILTIQVLGCIYVTWIKKN